MKTNGFKITFCVWWLLVGALATAPLYMTGTLGRTVKAGEISIPRRDVNPFQSCETNTVLEVRGGWVRYANQYGTLHESKLSFFRSMYKQIGTTAEKP